MIGLLLLVGAISLCVALQVGVASLDHADAPDTDDAATDPQA